MRGFYRDNGKNMKATIITGYLSGLYEHSPNFSIKGVIED